MSLLNGPLERLRRPEYTGENRCFPCTVLNVGIASVASVVLAVAWFPAGVLAFTSSLVAIYLRGYLIPGTPTITQRYFPERVLRAFGKEPKRTTRRAGTTSGDAPPSSADTSPEPSADSARDPANDDGLEAATDEDGERDLELLLTSSGVVEECDDEDDLCLTDGFASAWWRRIREIRDDDDAAASRLAETLHVDPDGIGFEPGGARYAVTYEGDRIGLWDSNAAFYADLAVEPTLSEWFPEWNNLSDQDRTQLIAGMRAFLQSCPNCESALEQVENVRETCCSSSVVGVDVDCSECGARVFSGRY
jgi:hypothetical protein